MKGITKGFTFDFDKALNNPLTIAGANVLQGQPLGTALTNASMLVRDNELKQAQMQRYQAEQQENIRKQLLAQSLPDVIRQLNPSNMQDAIAKLIAAGADPSLINSISNNIKPDVQDKFNPVTGEIVRFQNNMATGNIGGGGGNFANSPVGQREAYQVNLAEQKEKGKETRAQLDKINEVGNQATATITHLDELEALLPDFYSGQGADKLHEVGSFFGNDASNAAKTFDAEAKKLVLKVSENQKGAQSERDMALIKAAAPGLDKNEDTNKNIFTIAKALNYREKQYADAAQAWVEQGGDIREFDKRWRKYSNAFRIIEKEGIGKLKLNEENLNNWEIVLDPEFDDLMAGNEPIIDRNPSTSKSSNKIKASNGNLYTREQLERIARGGK